MNAKFTELARQAGFIDIENSGRFDGATVFGTTHDTALRYLVELVAEECIDVCESYRGTAYGKAAECVSDRIKERFGIDQ